MARRYMFPSHGQGRNATPSQEGLEAATQTYLKGAILVRNLAGHIEEGGADPTDIAGVALEPGDNKAVGVGKAGFCPPLDSIIFEGSVDLSGAIDTGTAVQADIGARYGITKDANGIWYVDKTKVAVGLQRVEVIGLKDAVGTLNGRVFFKFL